MSNMYEGQYIVNSFCAINGTTKEQIQADERGYISLSAGDTVVFKSMYDDSYVAVNTLVFFADDGAIKVQLNDNTTYPFYVEAGSKRGVKNMRIYSFTAIENCSLYYEGIVC